MGNWLKKNVPVLRFPEFKKSWQPKTLEELADWSSGGTPSKDNPDYWGGDISWISASSMYFNILSDSEQKITELGLKNGSRLATKDSILILVRGSILYNRIPMGITGRDLAFNQDVKALEIHDKRELFFLFYWLKANENLLKSLVSGTGIGAGKLDTSQLKALIVFKPLIAEQEKIASFLGAVDTRLTQLRRKHELLQTYKRGVMQKIFSQQIRFRCDDGQPFHNWEKKKLGDMAINGFSNGVFNDPSKVGWGYRLINVKDIYTSRSINVDSLTMLNLEEEEFRKNQAEYGDIFFTRSSLVKEGIAHSNILLSQDQDITYDGHLIRFRFNHEFYLPQFLGLALKSAKVRQQLVARGKTGTMTTIGQEDIASVQALIPCKQEQEKIAGFLTAIDQKIEAIAKQIELTEQFKKGLLQKMFV
ncbi:restriction endonuclease subunit S [Phormidium tenue]|uniref:Restriction endonuclease subunit S n=1 Tax=Phormidium tenue FACHB-1050 TaxID=2692857 RepID=A0ABR8CBE7_9CYAN|nr:restriction endonuclease subunit S [Phormidium tenue]MBD2317661.1 restriction endonuclease subunit S [Phormidium tenue FACHB-1050]